MDLKVLRGKRIEDQLDSLEEDSTYPQLHGNIVRGFPETRKRQHATAPVHVQQTEYIPYLQDGVLRVDSQVRSTGSGKMYKPTIMLRNVNFQPEDLPTNTTFRAADNNE